MAFDFLTAGTALLGGLLQSNAMDSAASSQAAADAARLAEEKRVREQLRADTETQRAVADQAFADYQAGLISYAEAQQRAANAYGSVQQSIAESRLSDTAKAMEMAQFQPYSIRTGSGRTFFDQAKGVAGYALSPELQAMQQSAYGKMGDVVGSIATSPEAAAAQYVAQQQGLLAPQRQQEDIALRQQQLQRGRIGLGISSEAAGAGTGGMVNPEQFQRDRARALADAQIAAQGTQQGMAQQANQAQLAQSLYNMGVAPENMGLNLMNAGMNYGQTSASAGLNQANLYNQGMQNYYGGMLGAAQTGMQAAGYVPQAYQTGLQEAYQRQQTALSGLQGNQLQYQAMTTPQAAVPGSAYAMAGLGSGLLGIGTQGIGNALKNVTSYSGTNSLGNPVYNPYLNTGGFSGTSLGGFFTGTGTSGD